MQAQLQQDGIGVCRTRWGKNLGGGLAEFRVSAPSEQGEVMLRIFFHAFGDRRSSSSMGTTRVKTRAQAGSSARSRKPNDG